jgi:hypothetical protein
MFRIFRELLGPENVGPMLPGFHQIDIHAMSRFRLLGGHLEFQQVKHFGQRRLFTMLRDPVEHLVSKYYFYRNAPDSGLDPMVRVSRQLSFEELVNQEPLGVLRFYFNFTVWQLAGMGFSKLRSDSEGEALRLAKEHLAECCFVGIVEQLPDSLDLMSYTFGWPPVETIPRENVTTNRLISQHLEPELRKRIVERSYLDMELYEFGVSLFAKRKREMMRAEVIHKQTGFVPEVVPQLNRRRQPQDEP